MNDNANSTYLQHGTNTRHFGHCKQEKRQIFMQEITIFLNFYKTKDIFFVLIVKQKTPAHNISFLEKLYFDTFFELKKYDWMLQHDLQLRVILLTLLPFVQNN